MACEHAGAKMDRITFPARQQVLMAAGWRFNYTRRCRLCPAMLDFWWTPAGKMAPLEMQPDGRYVSHFATCPAAEKFRKPRQAALPLTAALLLLLLAPSAHAKPHWYTAVPKAMGRTAVNMVTFRRPAAAIEEWAVVGAVAADYYTTANFLTNCPGCQETNLLLGTRPSLPHVAVFGLVVAASEATTVQYGAELTSGSEGSRWWKLAPAGVAGGWVLLHATAAATNASLR
jgi:hypothetical protein